jgi:hypothetical protein
VLLQILRRPRNHGRRKIQYTRGASKTAFGYDLGKNAQ